MASYDPFEKYQDAFQSIVPPAGITVQASAPVALSPDQEAQSRYDRFLVDQGINPNTIGTATIDPHTGGLIVPTVAQEYAAINASNQLNAREGDLRRAAHMAWQRGHGDTAMEYKAKARDLNNKRGGSYESRLAYFLQAAREAAANASYITLPSANGFSG